VNTGSATAITVDGDDVVLVVGYLPDPAETRKLGQRQAPATMIHHTVHPPMRSRKVTTANSIIASDRRIFGTSRWVASGVLGAQIVQFGTDAQPDKASTCEWGRMCAALRLAGIFQALGSGCPDGGGARREMVAAASSLLGAPSLRRMCETWTLAVLTLMTSTAAISRLV
jgi:hypothetical protein